MALLFCCSTETLVLNLSTLAWPNSTRGTVPRSICSEPCPKGYIRNFQVNPSRQRQCRLLVGSPPFAPSAIGASNRRGVDANNARQRCTRRPCDANKER